MRTRNPWIDYAIAIATTMIVAGARAAYDVWFGKEPVIPFVVPVAVAGWLSGLRCGLFATALNASVAVFFFTDPVYSFGISNPGDGVRIVLFTAVGVGISFLSHQLHHYLHLAEEHARESLVRQAALEQEVAERRETEKLLVEHRERLLEGATALETRVAERTRELEDQRRLLDAILDAIPAAVIIADPSGRVTRMNHASKQVWGQAPMSEDLEAYREWVGYWPDSGCRIEPSEWAMSRALFQGESCPGELVEFERFGDGSRRYMMHAGAPVFGPSGEIVAGVVATLDVTDRIAAERASRDCDQRFRAIFHAQFQFIGLMSPEGVLLEVNRTALASAGVQEAEVLGRLFWETAWWNHDTAQQSRLQQAIRQAAAGQPDRFEASYPRPDGTLIWMDFSLTPHIEGGRVVLLIPEGRDITERKRAEAAIRESEKRFRAVVEACPSGLLMTDAHGRIVIANEVILRMFGWTLQELLGQPVERLIPERFQDQHGDDFRAFVAAPKTRLMSSDREVRGVRKDGPSSRSRSG
jgi:PAS domain S-box-containing protein